MMPVAMCADDVDLDRDRILVGRFQAGDSAAFDELYLTYYARLVRYCQRRVDHLHEAEEIAQEAFARAWSALPRLGGDQRFYPWLTVIASRLCIDALRKRTRDMAHPATADLPAVGSDELVVDALDQQDVVVAMARLSDRYREVLALREQLGWSYREIAEHYSVSLGTIELLLFRARRALRKEYLAINGADVRIAAGLPFLPWFRTKLASLRSKLDAAVAQGVVPLGANVASVALMVGATTGVIAIGGADVQPAVASAPAPIVVKVAQAGVPGPAGGSHPSSPVAPSAPGTTELDPNKTVTALKQDFEKGEQFNDDAPIVVGIGGVRVGADPDTAGKDIGAGLGRVQASIGSAVRP
jgi:RNA polymerase sigma factor (sigma-70 family)